MYINQITALVQSYNWLTAKKNSSMKAFEGSKVHLLELDHMQIREKNYGLTWRGQDTIRMFI